jgi:tetratricopeptide (TPR) repeat protein
MRKILFIILAISISIFGISCANAKEKMTPKGKVNLRNANMYLQQMKLDKAMSFYEEVLKENPNNLEAIKKTGDIYFAWGEEKGSQPIDTLKSQDDQQLQKIKHDVESVDAYYNAFQKYTRFQELVKDRTDLTKDEDGWKVETAKKMLGCEARIFNIGKIYVTSADYETAVPIFEKLHSMDPQKPEAMKMLLFIYLDQQSSATENEKASYNAKIEDLLNKLLEINPNDLDTLSKLGAFYYTNKQTDKALEIFKKIEVQKPKDIDNLFSMVGIYNDKKMSKEAYETDLKILALEPNNLDAVDNARILAMELKKTDDAKKYFAKLIELDKTTDNISQYCIFLSSNAMYADLLPVAQEWYEMDNQSKDAVNFIVFAATKLGKKELVNYYTAVAKKMK